MFELETAIRLWRQEMAAALGNRPEVVDELESHLREEMVRASLAGQPAETAWAAAVARLGSPAALAAEFAKTPAAAWRWAPGWICAAVYLVVIVSAAIPMLGMISQRELGMILVPHVFFILAGYLATMTFGGLSAWLTVSRIWGGVTRRRIECLRWWGWRFALAATALCLAGFVFGSVWGRLTLGAFWTNDPREFGGVAMIVWNLLGLAWLARPRSVGRIDLALGLVGNCVVGVSWFVACLLASDMTPMAFWPAFLAAYFGGNAALLIVACWPMKTLRAA